MTAFVTPVLLTVIVGLIASVMLAVAAKFMSVPVNETATKIRECLPGANCGACGFAGCDDYAAALAADPTIKTNLCIPGADAAAAAVAGVLGQEALDVVEMLANVRCSGVCGATSRIMDYQGYKTCASVKAFFGGPWECKYGCIGFGDCVKACPYNAISVCNGIARVDRTVCAGCGACAKVCPQGLIQLNPDIMRVHVECSSKDKGKATVSACKAGCIGCGKCEKTCKFDAIHVVDNHAVIDYDKCKNCGMCAKECPRHIILVFPKANVKPMVKVDAE